MNSVSPTYINIGLVGHVANGKTTLVKKLTGVNTKRDSSEIKSGRTVKLGYANCLTWKCPNCGCIYTSGQAQKTMECCGLNIPAPTHYISFIDAPGHHSYVQTMVKGTVVLDGAITVTDIRADSLQLQTQEHLAILEILGIKDIIIVQNKVDLADEKQCLSNYDMLRRELVGTVAEDAPIVPISAQSGYGLENVQKMLYEMAERVNRRVTPDRDRETKSQEGFVIIRSFDINKPNTGVEDLTGGVLGGTSTGNKIFSVGDIVEIRPGINGRPIQTKITSIFSENKKCQQTGRGGLYGLGTTLDPTLTKSNRLVGAVVGSPGQMGDAVKKITMKITQMKQCIGSDTSNSGENTGPGGPRGGPSGPRGGPGGPKAPKIQTGGRYHLIIGASVIRAIAEKVSKNIFTFNLLQPVYLYTDRCLIYTEDTKLIGFGTFGRENITNRLSTLNIESLPIQNRQSYISLLPGHEQKIGKKVTIPVPVLLRENKDLIWSNMDLFCTTINRENKYVEKYIQQELILKTSICQGGMKLFKTRLSETKFISVLKKYIVENVRCNQCNSLNTTQVDNMVCGHDINCGNCGAEQHIAE